MKECTEHFAIKLTQQEKEWLEKIVQQMTLHTLNYDSVRLGLELAYKKGKYEAWKN